MFWNCSKRTIGKVVPPVTTYPIKVTGVFTDKASGDAYINSKLVSGTLLNSSFSGGLYSFETSAGAEVGADYMQSLLTSGTSYEDLTPLITTYGNNAFEDANISSVKLGNGVTFGDNAFLNANTSTIEVGNFIANGSHTFGAGSANNTFRFKGTIGVDGTMNAQLSFDLVGQTLQTIVANQTSGPSGTVEGDLADLIAGGATVQFIL